MNIQWGIAQNALAQPNPGERFQMGFQQGQEQRKQRELDGALRQLASNPDDPNARNALLHADPRMYMQFQKADLERLKAERERVGLEASRRIGGMAAGGDVQGARTAALRAGNFDLAKTLDGLGAPDKEAIKRRSEYIGNAALRIQQLPPEQRAAAWDHYARQGPQFGVDGLDQYVGQYSEEALHAAIAQAGMVKDYFDANKIDWRVTPEGGRMDPFDAFGRPLAPDRMSQPSPQAAPPQDEAGLRAAAAEAIAAGADPAQVNARLEQMLKGGAAPASGQANFPQ